MIGEGRKVRFTPCYETRSYDSGELTDKSVTGKIIYINWEHKMFTVEYGNPKMKESFKFWQIGSEVQLCGRF